MLLRYALYERTRNGYQWTWRAAELKDSLLDDFLYRIQIPDDANTIRPEDLSGGILKFSQVHGSTVDEHIVLYRFYDGGSDENGRRRATMLAAWTTTNQFPAPPAANGVLELLRNPTFEYVSDKAWTINIERPYSLDGNEPMPETVDALSAALAEFVHGLTDEDHDYSLTIQNDNHAVQKTPSAAFKYRAAEAAKRKQEDEQRKADQVRQETEEAKRQADERKREDLTSTPMRSPIGAAKRQADERKREDEEKARTAEKKKQDDGRLAKEISRQNRKNPNRSIMMKVVILITVTFILIPVTLIGRVIYVNNLGEAAKREQAAAEQAAAEQAAAEQKQAAEREPNRPATDNRMQESTSAKQGGLPPLNPQKVGAKPPAKLGLDSLSGDAQKVVDGYKQLPSDEQKKVLSKIQSIANEQGRSPSHSP